MSIIVLFGWMLFMSVGVFGGGQTFIPFLENIFVDTGLIDIEYFYEIVGLANAFPGPFSNKLFVLFIYQEFNIWIAILASIIFVIPGIVIMTLASRGMKKLKKYKPFTNVTLYINATVAGLLGFIGFSISQSYIFKDNMSIVIGTIMVVSNLILFNFVKNKKVLIIILNMIIAVVIL